MQGQAARARQPAHQGGDLRRPPASDQGPAAGLRHRDGGGHDGRPQARPRLRLGPRARGTVGQVVHGARKRPRLRLELVAEASRPPRDPQLAFRPDRSMEHAAHIQSLLAGLRPDDAPADPAGVDERRAWQGFSLTPPPQLLETLSEPSGTRTLSRPRPPRRRRPGHALWPRARARRRRRVRDLRRAAPRPGDSRLPSRRRPLAGVEGGAGDVRHHRHDRLSRIPTARRGCSGARVGRRPGCSTSTITPTTAATARWTGSIRPRPRRARWSSTSCARSGSG